MSTPKITDFYVSLALHMSISILCYLHSTAFMHQNAQNQTHLYIYMWVHISNNARLTVCCTKCALSKASPTEWRLLWLQIHAMAVKWVLLRSKTGRGLHFSSISDFEKISKTHQWTAQLRWVTRSFILNTYAGIYFEWNAVPDHVYSLTHQMRIHPRLKIAPNTWTFYSCLSDVS